MTSINTFESAFKAADKAVFTYRPVAVDRVLLVTDLARDQAAAMIAPVRAFLSAVDDGKTEWSALGAEDFDNVKSLLDRVEEQRADLIVTWRHLRSDAWRWPFSLGEYLDVLVQATTTPVLVLPHPEAGRELPHTVANTDRVMAMTDHLTGDDRLVNCALAFTQPGGTCWLTHIEGEATFARYMTAISKIPEIETEEAGDALKAQLLKEPRDFIGACRAAIEAQNLPVEIGEIVTMGDRLEQYRRLIEEHEIDLLVFYTKDEDQLAMHGMAYPLAVELRQIPLLML